MMSPGSEQALLDFLKEPAFLLTPQGTILQINAAAARLLGPDRRGVDLASHVDMSAEAFRSWLSRCSGTTSALVGMLPLRRSDGTVRRFRAHGARLRDGGDEIRIAVRCIAQENDGFALLKQQIAELNADARERRRKQALLEETLHLNEVMLRELNHRVKNNIQLMVGLFSAAIRETEAQEVKAVLHAANQRLLAVGAAQDLMYESQQMATVSSAPFIHALVRTLSVAFGETVHLDVSAADGRLSNESAFPLALILNELLTNAVKHGLTDGKGTIGVSLQRQGDEFSMIVQDSGAGIEHTGSLRHSSGLGLVRGLCRQIGAKLEMSNENGARVTVRFTNPQEESG